MYAIRSYYALEIHSIHDRNRERRKKMDIKKSKYRTLQNILEKMDRVAVAFSGGVDSTFLLRTARDTLGDRVMAVTALSETVPRHEGDDIRNFVRELGVLHRLVETREKQGHAHGDGAGGKSSQTGRNNFV